MGFNFSNLFGSAAGQRGRSVVGIDIGASSIKVVQLHDKKGVPTLDTYGELQLGPYGSVEIGRTTNLQPKKLTEAVVDILRESSVTTKNAAVAVSYSSSFATVVTVAASDKDDIQSMVPVEARKYIPVPIKEVTLDWFPIATNPKTGETKVMLAAIHNTAMDRYRNIVKNASLAMTLMELEIFSGVRASATQEDATVAVVDLGANATKLFIARQGVVQKTHSVRMGGVEITKALEKQLEISFEEAEELKRGFSLGDTTQKEKRKIITAILERGFREIHKVIKTYEQQDNTTVGRVVFCGNGALLRGLPEYAQDILQYKVDRSDAFSKVAYPAFLEDTLIEAGPVFATAIGVALQAFNTDIDT